MAMDSALALQDKVYFCAMKLSYFFYLCLLASGLSAQDILPGLQGQALLDALATEYRPATVLDYNDARDFMYGELDVVNDSIFCVYTGFGIQRSQGITPRTDAFNKGINTEHTWPQGFGAGQGSPRSNLHHIFPSRIDVNGDRGSLPFGEIPDGQTSRWYYLGQNQSTIPPLATRPLYSELLTNERFEPREDHKGNVARAMFYFYAMYRAESDAEDPNFFPPQIQTLCDWHDLDPVDARELARTEAIASIQDGKINPFVVDCNLLSRTYCPNLLPISCLSSSSTSSSAAATVFQHLGVGRNEQGAYTLFRFQQSAQVAVQWLDLLGRPLASQNLQWLDAGVHIFQASQQQQGPQLGRFSIRSADGHWYSQTVLIP